MAGGFRTSPRRPASRCRARSACRRRSPTSTTTAIADLYVTTVRAGNLLFENDGKGSFRDITAASGLSYTGHSSAAVFFDYNRDGRLDLFLVNVGRYTTDVIGGAGYQYYVAFEDAFSGHLKPERAEASMLYRNDGKNRFVNVSKAMGLQDLSWSGDAAAVDVNDDGWLDLYVLNMQGDDQYYENAAGKRFVRKSREVFPRTSWGAMGIKVFDANNDGRLDILITDMHSDMSEPTPPEQDKVKSTMKWPESFRGTGKTQHLGQLALPQGRTGTVPRGLRRDERRELLPWGPSIGDLNADGFDDVFIAAGMNYPYRYMINSAQLNDRGSRFADAEFVLGIEPRQDGIATPWFQLDASGQGPGAPGCGRRDRPPRLSGARAAPAPRPSSISTATATSTSSPTSSAPRRWCW